MSRVVLEGITKRYPGGVEAVSNVSLVVDDGEFLTLVGPSGCGKTTTLRTIAGFEQPTEGFVGINDNRVNTVPPDKRDIGMVFQDFALFPHKTVAENIAYGLKVRDYEDDYIEERVDEMLELVELPETRDRMPDQLSGGERALFNLSLRCAIYRLLSEGIEGSAPTPPLILDEPTVFLDSGHVSKLVELIESMTDHGVAQIIVVSHDEELVGAADDLIAVRKDPTTNRSSVERSATAGALT